MKTVNYGAIDVTVTATDINSSIFTLGTGQPRIAPIGRGCLSVNSEAPVVGNETMLGYPVVHTRVPDDVMIDEQWIAKSLDCLELRRVYTYLDKGQPTGAQDALAATSVTLGEPDPALFALPANPVEVTPLTLANQVDPEAVNSFLNLDKISVAVTVTSIAP